MNSDLDISFKSLQQSIDTFNLIMHEFLKKSSEFSAAFVNRFMIYKRTHKKHTQEAFHKAVYRQHETYELLAFKDSLKQRFNTCYNLSISFLKLYLEEKHGIVSKSIEELFDRCLEQNIITSDEAKNLTALSKELALFSLDQESDIPENVVQYGIVMHEILKRLNDEN